MVATDEHTRSRARVDVSGTTSRRFECTEDGASKFWEVVVDGASLTTRWGRLGTTGQAKTKAFADASAAVGEMQKLVRENTRMGYVEVDASRHAEVAVLARPSSESRGEGAHADLAAEALAMAGVRWERGR